MKKIFILLFLLTAFSLSCFSQSGIYSGGVSKNAQHDLRKTGWIVRPDMGIAQFNSAPCVGGGIGIDFGYQLSPRLFLGGGMTFLIRSQREYDLYSGIYGYDNLETLYASARWYWFDGKSSPFLELNTGVGRFAYHYDWDDNNSHIRGAFFAIPTLGYDIRNVDFKIGALLSTNAVPFVVYLMFGYNFLIN